MKNLKFALLALTACFTTNIFAASIDHIQNYSAEYGANPAQQGAINIGSTVYFNPAGLMRLENGTYFVGGLQYAFGKQTMKESGNDYSADLSSPIPNIALYRKTTNGAYYFTMGALGGGAELEYKDGIPLSFPLGGQTVSASSVLSHLNVTGSNQYAQATIGKVVNLTDKWSAALGLRGVYAKRDLTVDATTRSIPFILPEALYGSFESERTASGFGAQVSFNYAHSDRLNMAFRYDTAVRLDFETKASSSGTGANLINNALTAVYPVYTDGLKLRRDLPALLAAGASYKVTDKWTTYIGGNYYFNEAASLDKVNGKMVNGKTLKAERISYKNGWEVSLGSEYQFNDKYSWLLGFNYADTGAPGESYSASEYAIDSTMVGTGVKFAPNDTLEFVLAYNHYFYNTTSYEKTTYKKEISSVGFNFVKKFDF